MNFLTSVKTCFKKSFTYKGRAARSEFWWFHLFLTICFICSMMADYLVFKESNSYFNTACSMLIFPQIAVYVRRIHDLNLSGFWVLPYAVLSFAVLLSSAILSVFTIFVTLNENLAIYLSEHVQEWEYFAEFYDKITLGVLKVVSLMNIAFVIMFVSKGTSGENRYGDDPLRASLKTSLA